MFELWAKQIRNKRDIYISDIEHENLIHTYIDRLDPDLYSDAYVIDKNTKVLEHYFPIKPKVKTLTKRL